MKRLSFTIVFMLLASISYADTIMDQSLITPVATDQIWMIDDPGGTPGDGRATVQSVMDLVFAQIGTAYDTEAELDALFAAKQNSLTFGIADNNAVEIDDADAADNDYAKITANGLEGRSYSEVRTDIGVPALAGESGYSGAHDFGSVDSIIPCKRLTDCSGQTGDGQCCWDIDSDILYFGTGAGNHIMLRWGQSLGEPSAGILSNCTNLPLSTGVTGQLPVANGGTGASDAATARSNLSLYSQSEIDAALALKVNIGTDPDADRIYFWDDSAGEPAYLTVGTGLSLTGTTLTATGTAPALNEVTTATGPWTLTSGTYDHLITLGLNGEWRFQTASGHYISLGNIPLTGTHTGSNNAATLTDSAASFVVNELIGTIIYNTTDSSSCTITANDATTVTCTLSGGTDNDWDTDDAYSIARMILSMAGSSRMFGGTIIVEDEGVHSKSDPGAADNYYVVAQGYDTGASASRDLITVYNSATVPYVLLGDRSGAAGLKVNDDGSMSLEGGAQISGVDAATGDSATAFFDTGTLEAARLPAATTSAQGAAELATTAETNTGTDATRAVTPDGLAGSIFGTIYVTLRAVENGDSLATGDSKDCITWAWPDMDLISVLFGVYGTSSSGTPTFQIRNATDTQDMLSTSGTIDVSEYNSNTAAVPPVINTSYDDVTIGDRICLDVDVAGTGTTGGDAILGFRLP